MKKLISLILAMLMVLSMAAIAETVDSSVISADEKAAALGRFRVALMPALSHFLSASP